MVKIVFGNLVELRQLINRGGDVDYESSVYDELLDLAKYIGFSKKRVNWQKGFNDSIMQCPLERDVLIEIIEHSSPINWGAIANNSSERAALLWRLPTDPVFFVNFLQEFNKLVQDSETDSLQAFYLSTVQAVLLPLLGEFKQMDYDKPFHVFEFSKYLPKESSPYDVFLQLVVKLYFKKRYSARHILWSLEGHEFRDEILKEIISLCNVKVQTQKNKQHKDDYQELVNDLEYSYIETYLPKNLIF